MKFVLKPSLEHMALVKIVISLWNQKDVRDLILSMRFHFPMHFNIKSEEWNKIEDRVIQNVQQLSLPQLLKDKVLGFVKPIGLEINEWVEFHCIRLHLCVSLPAELCWTPQGTIDRKKTAEVLIRNENLEISTCCKLACIYCLEDDIHKFWNNVTEDIKRSISHDFPPIRILSLIVMGKKLQYLQLSYKQEFENFALSGNKAAVEYFLQKLTPREREESLVKIARNVNKADVLCILLSEMDEGQQMEVFKNNTYRVLQCFLQWPWQDLFIGMANHMHDFLSKESCENILEAIICKVRDGYKDCNYQNLFKEFWQESPSALKSLITDEMDESLLLPFLFDIKDKEIIRIILRDTTLAVKDKLIYKNSHYCESFIRDNEWDFLEFFIRECLPSKSEMLKFKEEFEKRVMHSYCKEDFVTKKRNWDKVFHFSDDSNFKYGKRSIEEGEISSSKRFRSQQ